MPVRALVIAIEEYSQAEGLAHTLEGTHDAADAFIAWLETAKKVSPGRIRYCGAPGRQRRTAGTTREEILKEVQALVAEGRDTTDELYVFISGHGFAFEESLGRRPVDILVTSEFVRPADSGGACIKLRELQERLQTALGYGDHYYFVDTCRNLIPEDEIEPLALGKRLGRSSTGVGTLFTLYSTAEQSVARTESGFSQHLVQGLNGRGRAKDWVQNRMFVTFDRLHRYVRSKMPQQEAELRKEGSSEGRIVEIDPIPFSKCSIVVRNANEQDAFTVRGQDHRGLVTKHNSFQGKEGEIALPPGEYLLVVEHPQMPLKQVVPAEATLVDAYEEACRVEFVKQPQLQAFPLEGLGTASSMTIRAPVGTEVKLMRMDGRAPSRLLPNLLGTVKQSVPPGLYKVEFFQEGRKVGQRDITLAEEQDVSLQFAGLEEPQLPEEFRALDLVGRRTPGKHRVPALALGLLGAGRIVSPRKLSRPARELPLHDFSTFRQAESLLYVLAYFPRQVLRVPIAVGRSKEMSWHDMRSVPGVNGLWEGMIPAARGPSIFSVQVASADENARALPLSYVTHLLPHQATFISVTEREDGALEVNQYFLPLPSRTYRLPFHLRRLLDHDGSASSSLIEARWEVQHAFARKETLETSLGRMSHDLWHMSLEGLGFDPLMALLGGYELLWRHPSFVRYPPKQALDNLKSFAGDIPDVQVLARLVGRTSRVPRSPPLLLDGLMAGDFEDSELPLSASKLTYEGPWVSWRGAVKPPDDED